VKENKIVRLLRAFSIEEMKEFEKIVASPYFSRGRDLMPVFKVLKSFYPDFSGDNLNSKYIFQKLYPGKRFDEKTSLSLVNTLTSELYKVGKVFLIQQGLEESETAQIYFLLNSLRKKKQFGELEKELGRLEESQTPDMSSSSLSYVKRYLLDYPFLENAIGRSDFQSATERLSSQSDKIIIAAIISSVNILEQKAIAENVYNVISHKGLADILLENLNLKQFIEELRSNGDQYFPILNVWHHLHLMNFYPDKEEHFFELKSLVYENIDKFSQDEKYMIFGKLESYCIEKSRSKENEKFARIEFELYVKSLELGCHRSSKDDPFHIVLFRNILFSGLDCKEYNWVEYFINNFADELLPEQRINLKYYSLAFLEFERKNFEASLEHLAKVEYTFLSFKIDVKVLLFKLYYELGYFDNALSVLNSTKQYINNTDDLSASFKSKYKLFTKYCNELLSIKLSKNPKDAGLILNELKKEDHIFSHLWLLKKLNELSA
jgi:hypothetical protein